MAERQINFGDEAPFRQDLVPVPGLPENRYAMLPDRTDVIVMLTGWTPDGVKPPYNVSPTAEFKQYINHLDERYGIPNVQPQYVVGMYGNERDDNRQSPYIYALENYVKDAVAFKTLVNEPESLEASLRGDALHAYDQLTGKLIASIQDAFNEGGVCDFEISALDQFVYSPSAPEGRQAILTDVEPNPPEHFAQPEERAHDKDILKRDAEELVRCYVCLFDTMLSLQMVSDTTFESRQKALDALRTVSSGVPYDARRDEFDITDVVRRASDYIRSNDLEGMHDLQRLVLFGPEE